MSSSTSSLTQMPAGAVHSGAFARALVVLPTYNEIDSLPLVIEHLLVALPTIEILVVDDNSPDGTGQWAEERRRTLPQLHVLHRCGKLGLGSAYKEGFAWGQHEGFDPLIEMDADASHSPMDVPALLAPMVDGADLVLGSRYVAGGSTPGWPANRRFLSTTSNALARRLLGLPIADVTSGFRAYHSELLHAIEYRTIKSDGYAFQVEALWRAVRVHASIVEVPIAFHDRALGASKINRIEVAHAAATLLRLRHDSWQPQRARLSRPQPVGAPT
jgi:dolichol-phosphate mannosyltransferase